MMPGAPISIFGCLLQNVVQWMVGLQQDVGCHASIFTLQNSVSRVLDGVLYAETVKELVNLIKTAFI